MPKARKKKRPPKRVLALPDLEQAKAAVLSSLTSKSGQRTYDRAITDFVEWYCSKPRLAFNRTMVLRYRIYLEQKQYAATTINLRLAAVVIPAVPVRQWVLSLPHVLRYKSAFDASSLKPRVDHLCRCRIRMVEAAGP